MFGLDYILRQDPYYTNRRVHYMVTGDLKDKFPKDRKTLCGCRTAYTWQLAVEPDDCNCELCRKSKHFPHLE